MISTRWSTTYPRERTSTPPQLPDTLRLAGTILHDHPDVVEYLIAHGVDIELRSEYGWSPLYIGAWDGSAESVALLLSAGAKLNTRTIGSWNSPSGCTPLHIAASAGRLAIVMLLVAAGANVDALTDSSEIALDRAIENEHPHVVKYLKAQQTLPGKRKSRSKK